MKILIATTAVPKSEEGFVDMCQSFREHAQQFNCTIEGHILWTDGPGCTNLAMDLVGLEDDIKLFADRLTMALMPAKWGTTSDELPDHDTLNVTRKTD